MQKEPKYPITFLPVKCSPDFPVAVSAVHLHRDQEITYLHVHDVVEIGLCLEGTGIFVVEGKVMTFRSGDVAVITPREAHLAQSTLGTTSRWIWTYVNLEKLLYPLFPHSGLTNVAVLCGPTFRNLLTAEEHPRLCRLVQELCTEAHGTLPLHQESQTALLTLIAVELQRLVPAPSTGSPADELPRRGLESDSLARVQKAIVFLTRNYRDRVNLAALAGLCGLSRTHFRRLFQQALGRTPQAQLNLIRVRMAAAELRQGNKPISIVAHDHGFPTLSCFNRQFRALTGQSPRVWRHSAHGGQ